MKVKCSIKACGNEWEMSGNYAPKSAFCVEHDPVMQRTIRDLRVCLYDRGLREYTVHLFESEGEVKA